MLAKLAKTFRDFFNIAKSRSGTPVTTKRPAQLLFHQRFGKGESPALDVGMWLIGPLRRGRLDSKKGDNRSATSWLDSGKGDNSHGNGGWLINEVYQSPEYDWVKQKLLFS